MTIRRNMFVQKSNGIPCVYLFPLPCETRGFVIQIDNNRFDKPRCYPSLQDDRITWHMEDKDDD